MDPADVTVLGQVQSNKGESSDQGETPSKKKKSSHKSPSKKSTKAGKIADLQIDLKNLEKWSERFARLEAMFLARSFQVPVEPVQKQDVVSDRPFIPPVQQTTSVTGQRVICSTSDQLERKKATQPVEAPSAVLATCHVWAPSAAVKVTSQDASTVAAADRPEVQPLGLASSTSTSGRPKVQPPGPTDQAAFDAKKSAVSITGSGHPANEPVSDTEPFSDHTSTIPVDEEVEAWSLLVQNMKNK